MESETPQVIFTQKIRTEIQKHDSKSPTIKYTPLDQYEVVHLTNFLDLDIRDILTKFYLQELMSKGVNVLVR